jgi:hypothetical protein
MVEAMPVRMRMSCRFPDRIGIDQDIIIGIINIMSPPNDLTVGMGGRSTAHEAISEEIMVEEMGGIVEDIDKK